MTVTPPPLPAPAPRTSWSTVALVGVVMLLVGGAAGWFLQPQLSDDDATDTAETSVETADTTAAPETTAAPTTTAAPLLRLAHTSGSFSIIDPGKGWQAQLDGASSASNSPIIRYAPDVQKYRDDGNAPGFSIADLTDTAATVDEYLDAGGTPTCPTSPREPFTRGDFTGFRNTTGPCPATADYSALTTINVAIAGTRPDGTEIGMIVHVTPETPEEMVLQALDSFTRP